VTAKRLLVPLLVLAAALVFALVVLPRLGRSEGDGPSRAAGSVLSVSADELCLGGEDARCYPVDRDYDLQLPAVGDCVRLELARPTFHVLSVEEASCDESTTTTTS
jgi:hypothetical protein